MNPADPVTRTLGKDQTFSLQVHRATDQRCGHMHLSVPSCHRDLDRSLAAPAFFRIKMPELCRSKRPSFADQNARSLPIKMPDLCQSKCFVVDQYADGAQNDLQITQHRPPVEVFQVGLQPVGQVGFGVGCPPQTAHLGQPGQARFQRMAE